MKDTTGMQDSTETIAVGYPHAVEGRRGPTWRGWAFSILVAIVLSVMATLLLGGSGSFRPDRPTVSGAAGGGSGSGSGSNCCPPADVGR